MVKSNSQGYRLRDENGKIICLPRSKDQKIMDANDNRKECKAQGFSPTTSKNTALNTYKKKEQSDPKKESLKEKKSTITKTVRFRTPSPKQEGGKKKRKTRRKIYSKKRKH